MTATYLKNLLERAKTWPEEAQDELVALANQIESELQGQDYLATQEELQVIDAAMASIDGGKSQPMPKLKQPLQNFGEYETRLFPAGAH